jgi:hypothetical protein
MRVGAGFMGDPRDDSTLRRNMTQAAEDGLSTVDDPPVLNARRWNSAPTQNIIFTSCCAPLLRAQAAKKLGRLR